MANPNAAANAPLPAPKFVRGTKFLAHTVPFEEWNRYEVSKQVNHLYSDRARDFNGNVTKRLSMQDDLVRTIEEYERVRKLFAQPSADPDPTFKLYFSKQFNALQVGNDVFTSDDKAAIRQKKKDFIESYLRLSMKSRQDAIERIEESMSFAVAEFEASVHEIVNGFFTPNSLPALLALKEPASRVCNALIAQFASHVRSREDDLKFELKLMEERAIQARHVRERMNEVAVAIPAQPAIQQIVENSVQSSVPPVLANLVSNLAAQVSALQKQVDQLNGRPVVENERSTSATGRGKNVQVAGKKGKNNGKGFAQQPSRKEGGKPSTGSNPSSNPRQGQPRNQSSNPTGTAEMGRSSANLGRSTNPVDRGGSRF
jgi:hypothetical protein